MKADNAVRLEAMNALITALGAVDAARFVVMVKRDTFDYTEWQRKLWDGKTIEEIHALATEREKPGLTAISPHCMDCESKRLTAVKGNRNENPTV